MNRKMKNVEKKIIIESIFKYVKISEIINSKEIYE